MLVVPTASIGCFQQMLGQNDARAGGRTVGAVAAFSNAVETVAGRDNPGVRGRTFEVLAEILERRGVLWGEGGEVVDGFVDARGETCGGDVVAQDSAVDDLGKECGAGDKVADEVRDVFLAFRSEGLLITGATAE